MKQLAIHQHCSSASQLIFGCMGLGGSWGNDPITDHDIKVAHDAIDAAFDAGINFFDHADIYTMGKAEQVFAKVLNDRPEIRDHIIIQSKCGIRLEDASAPGRYDFSPEYITAAVDGILSRLDVSYIDTLLLHRPDPLMEPWLIAETFDALYASGKVKAFGVSNMHQGQMQYLNHYLSKPLVANQLELSLNHLDWLNEGILAGQSAGSDINFTAGTLEYCQMNNVQVQAWGSLAQGLFSGKSLEGQPPHIHQTAELVEKLAAEYQTSKEAILLAFIMRHPVNIQPIIGTTNPERIRACALATNIKLTREHWYQLFVSARGNRVP